MKVACAPDSVTVPAGQNARFQLFNKRVVASEGEVAATMLEAIGRAGIAPDQRAWDFLSIARSVIAADESCPRNSSGDGWTRTIELTVAFSNPKAWTKRSSAQRKKAFLDAIADGETVTSAASIAGVNRVTVYDWKKVPAFAEAWNAALDAGTGLLVDVARKRATAGSDVLLMFLLKARDPKTYCDRARFARLERQAAAETAMHDDRGSSVTPSVRDTLAALFDEKAATAKPKLVS